MERVVISCGRYGRKNQLHAEFSMGSLTQAVRHLMRNRLIYVKSSRGKARRPCLLAETINFSWRSNMAGRPRRKQHDT